MKTVICHYCEEQIDNPTKDHVFPKSKIRKILNQGEDLPDYLDLNHNTVVSCFECNQIKGTKDYDSFVALGVKAIRHLKKCFMAKKHRKTKFTKSKYKKAKK